MRDALPPAVLGLVRTWGGRSVVALHNLSAEPQSLRLDWKNVIVDDRRDTEASVISLAEFTVNRELKRSAVLVRFDRK